MEKPAKKKGWLIGCKAQRFVDDVSKPPYIYDEVLPRMVRI